MGMHRNSHHATLAYLKWSATIQLFKRKLDVIPEPTFLRSMVNISAKKYRLCSDGQLDQAGGEGWVGSCPTAGSRVEGWKGRSAMTILSLDRTKFPHDQGDNDHRCVKAKAYVETQDSSDNNLKKGRNH